MFSASTSISRRLLLTLAATKAVLAAPSIWDVNILEAPAPPPDQGPPLSANAIRDTSYLPYDLVAIFGSYLVSIIIVGIAIVFIGRRRRAIQRSPQSLGMEMKSGLTGDNRAIGKLKAQSPPKSTKLWGPSPVSPTKFWQSPNLSLKQGWENIAGKSSQKTSIAGISITTLDESVLEDERARNELEMDRLYAAVAEYEETKEGNSPTEGPQSPVRSQNPPELQHLRHGMTPLQIPSHGRAEMVEPYPSRPNTMSPRAQTTSPPMRSVSGGSAKRGSKKTPPAPLSIHHTANSSRSSLASIHSRSLRNYPISPPMGSPGIAPNFGEMYDDAEPLTPRAYAPGPPPMPPTPSNPVSYLEEREQQRHRDVLASPQHAPDFASPRSTHFAPSIRSSRASNVTAIQTAGLPMSPRSVRPPMSARSGTFPRTITEQPSVEAGLRSAHTRGKSSLGGQSYASCESDIKPGFNFSLDPAPSGRVSPASSTHTAATATAGAKKGRKAAPQALALGASGTSAATSQLAPPAAAAGALPLRDMKGMLSPTSRGPPSAIKATFLERPAKRGPMGGLLRAPNTAGLAGPATPYSPYMPMTPMTPMTPSRLVTREERRRREKEEGRRVLTQDDVVQEESEMWGD